MIKTHVIWQTGTPDASQIDLIQTKVASMVAAGQTDGTYTRLDGPVLTEYTIERFWNDIAAAEEWIVFIEGFTPVSAAIINE